MIYLINGTDNQYDTAIERAALTMLTILKSAGEQARLVLMQPERETPAWLQSQGLAPEVVTLPGWLQENAAEQSATVLPISPHADVIKPVADGGKEFWQEGRLIATSNPGEAGTQIAKYFDSNNRIVIEDYVQAAGNVDSEINFDYKGTTTTMTFLARDGVVALRKKIAQDGSLEFFQVPKFQIVAQTPEQLWTSVLRALITPADTVISFRREYDSAVLALGNQNKRLAYVFRAKPNHATAFDALITQGDELNLDWLSRVRG